MRGAGTGYPIAFRCAKCRSTLVNRKSECVRTGRTKPLATGQCGSGHSRALMHRVEYRCLACAHTGWTRHADVMDCKLEEAQP